MKLKQVNPLVMVLLFFTSIPFAGADDALPEDGVLEFLGEFNADDDDILSIAFETPLDMSASKQLEIPDHVVIESMGAEHSE
jgi:hypothetical protein